MNCVRMRDNQTGMFSGSAEVDRYLLQAACLTVHAVASQDFAKMMLKPQILVNALDIKCEFILNTYLVFLYFYFLCLCVHLIKIGRHLPDLFIFFYFFLAGYLHSSSLNEMQFNAVRLCFQIFLPDSNGLLCVPIPPVISVPIYDKS